MPEQPSSNGGTPFRVGLQLVLIFALLAAFASSITFAIVEFYRFEGLQNTSVLPTILVLIATGILWTIEACRGSGHATPAVGIIGLVAVAVLAVVAIAQPQLINTGSTESQIATSEFRNRSDQDTVRQAIQATLESNTDGQLQSVSNLTLIDGTAAIYFDLENDQRIRIDAYASDNMGSSIENLIDTNIRLYKRRGRNGIGDKVAENDDGGSRFLSSRIERQLKAGPYILVVEDLNSFGQDRPINNVVVEITEIAFSDFTPIELQLGGTPLQGSYTFSGDVYDPENAFLLSFVRTQPEELQRATDSCLVIRIRPTKDDGDTFFMLFESDTLEMKASGDDSQHLGNSDLGEWSVIVVESEWKSAILRVGAFDESTEFQLYLSFLPGVPGNGDICAPYRPTVSDDPLQVYSDSVSIDSDANSQNTLENQSE